MAAPLLLSLGTASALLDGCREATGTAAAQTEREIEARPLLDDRREVTGTASTQTERERRGRCWMAVER